MNKPRNQADALPEPRRENAIETIRVFSGSATPASGRVDARLDVKGWGGLDVNLENFAAEIRDRYNAFPELVEALRNLLEHGDEVEVDSSEVFQGFTARVDRVREQARAILTKYT